MAAELIREAKAGRGALYNVNGAQVEILGSPEGKGVPGWVETGDGLRLKRYREYREKTGHGPDAALVERYDAAMAERLRAFFRDPLGCPFTPLSLQEYERTEAHGKEIQDQH